MTQNVFGFSTEQWNTAKKEMLITLQKRASERQTITYSELSRETTSIPLGPHDFAMSWMLGEVSEEEHEAGRPLLSALVVYKETGFPGPGFYDLAIRLGRKVTDRDSFWVNELQTIFTER